MINPGKILRYIAPILIAIAVFMLGRWYGTRGFNNTEAINIEHAKQLHELELNNLRMEYELRVKHVEVEFLKQREHIDKMSTAQIDSVWHAHGF
jgi:hypothetical protein